MHTTTPTPSTPKIAIIGAGPAGLTLASLLHTSPHPFNITIYERETSASSHLTQGGTLDLHHTTGLAALRKCNLMTEFRKTARYDGDEMRMMDKNATCLVWKGASSGDTGEDARPEVDRSVLVDILLGSLPSGVVRYGRKLRGVSSNLILDFGADGEEGPFDLVVGADGGWSAVRSYLTDVRPSYSGISGYEMDIPKPSVALNEFIGKGSAGCSSDSLVLGAQRMGNGSLKVRAWFQLPEFEGRQTLEKFGKKETKRVTLEKYEGWAPETLQSWNAGDAETLRCWECYELPVGHTWEHKRGVTLIGDAASLSAPFSGEGVNKAMRDALDLAALLEQSQVHDADTKLTLDDAIAAYEKSMFPRAHKLQSDTQYAMQRFFGPDTPISLITGMVTKMTGESDRAWVRMLGSWPVVAVLDGALRTRKVIGSWQRWWRGT